MKCFLCQHETNEHHEGGCFANSGDHICGCMVSEVEAIHAAQRAAAIAHLRSIGASILEAKKNNVSCGWPLMRLFAVIEGYRAVGILRERKP